MTTVTPKTLPLQIATDAAGNGSVQFTCTKSGLMFDVVKITATMAATSSGTVTLQRNGGIFLSSVPVAPRLEAVGSEKLNYSEYLTVSVIGGPASSTVDVWVSYNEIDPTSAPSTGLAWVQQLGTAGPVDNPVLLAEGAAVPLPGFFFAETGWRDVRAYNSVQFAQSWARNTWLFNDYITVRITYANNPDGSGQTYQSVYQVFDRTMRITDVVHGSYVNVSVADGDSTGRSINWTYQLYGSFRQVTQPWLGTLNNLVLWNSNPFIGAGARVDNPSNLVPILATGRAIMRLRSDGGAGRFRLTYGTILGAGAAYDEVAVTAANQQVTKEIILPRIQPQTSMFNDAAVAATLSTSVVLQVNPQ